VDVTLQPEIERMVFDRVQSGEYSSTSELVNTAVKNLLKEEHAATNGSGRPDLRSLELAKDAPANLEWLHRNRAAYMGEWVALHKGRLIAHGKNGLDVFQAAQSQGINPPLMHRIAPEESASWGGW
jgi:Arc/MetJ-type ribon-helix-helix transcriptional regulator